MSEKIKIEIDSAQLDALLNKLNASVAGGGGGVTSATGKGGGSVSTSSPRNQYLGGVLQSQPGGFLPSIPRGIRTTFGLAGGYPMVASYQKALWLEQGIGNIAKMGLTVAGVMELYTFAILMIVDIMKLIDEIKRNQEANKADIMNLSDIHNSVTYKEWVKVQNNQYRGRTP